MKQSRFFLTLTSFAVTLAIYLLYSYILVPILFPARQNPTVSDSPSVDIVDGDLLATIFKPDSWVLSKHSRISVGEKMTLLSVKMEQSEVGQVRFAPIVILYFPSDPLLSKKERYRQAIVMEAAEAVIEFNGELTTGNVQLKNGLLKGNVEIRSDMQNTDATDNLAVWTQDVRFDQKMIVTEKNIDFSYGPNRGKGHGMTIELMQSSTKGLANQMPDSVKRIEMTPPVEITYYFDSDETQNNAANKSAKGSAQLICKGKTEIVPNPAKEKEWFVTFMDSVDLHRINPEGTSDKMNCAQIQLTLGPKHVSGSYNNSLGGSSAALMVQLIDAIGHPVHLISTDNKNLDVKCERLTIDPVKNEMSMTQTKGNTIAEISPVSVRYDQLTLTGREIYYALGKNDEIGKLDINGAGMIQGHVGQGPIYPLQIKWAHQLQIAPDKDQRELTCVHAQGDIAMEVPGIGSLAADEAFIWCEQAPTTKNTSTNSQNALGKNISLSPKYALIQKNVRIKTDEGECFVKELKIWFQDGIPVSSHPVGSPIRQVAMRPIPQQSTTRTTTATGSTILKGGIFGDASSNGNSQFTIKADEMQIDARVAGEEPVVNQIILSKNVTLTEKQRTPSGEQPIFVSGQSVHIRQPGKQGTVVEIIGDANNYARFTGRGVSLLGTNININQSSNTFWMNGQGQLKVSGVNLAKAGNSLGNIVPNGTAQNGSASDNQEVIIDWLGKMQFDGSVISFEDQVKVAYTLGSIQNCDQLQVVLSKKFNFFESQAKQDIDVKRIIIKGIIDLDHDSYNKTDPQKLVSQEHIRINSIEINPNTGDFLAYGPGTISATFVSGDMTGRFDSLTSSGNTTPTPVSTSPFSALSFLHVDFYESVTGNFNTKQLNFNDRVRCVLFPVQSFAEKINLNDTRLIVSRGQLLTCDDKLTIADTALPGSATSSYLLVAEGNAALESTVQGVIYEGHGERMKYDQAKNLVVLEGGQYTPAVLSKKNSPGSMSEKVFDQLQKIELNLKTAEIRTQ